MNGCLFRELFFLNDKYRTAAVVFENLGRLKNTLLTRYRFASNQNTRNHVWMSVNQLVVLFFITAVDYILFLLSTEMFSRVVFQYKCFAWKNAVNDAHTLFRVNCLCKSLNNNEVPIITITSSEYTEKTIKVIIFFLRCNERYIINAMPRIH